MANHDLSRHLLRPAHHYTGVRMQQGRATLDSDFSEGEMLDDVDHRSVVVDVVGPHGSPDGGFEISNPSTDSYNFDIDFDIGGGSYYLGGMRHEIAGRSGPAYPQRFQDQTDWLQSNRDGADPAVPEVPKVPRRDLVYLVGWEQAVSAVEDREFKELALGGPDTSVRMRLMHRVYVHPDVAEDCTDAFKQLVKGFTDLGHDFDWTRHELKSGARLTVVLAQPPAPDVCKPALAAGYTGVENQAIRVQLIETERFLWSYDNAAPLYRVTVSTGENGPVVQFLTPPRDQAHFPVAGQVFELLPWGAELPNGERVADQPIAGNIGGGVLARVKTGYDPATETVQITVTDTAAAKLSEMTAWFGKNSITAKEQCFYLRVWNPGDGRVDGPIGVPFKGTEPVELPGTGLKLRLSKPGIIGDHWIIAARPANPSKVVPWQLLSGDAPHGPQRFYCPLALMHWSVGPTGGATSVAVDSCRKVFRPLTRLRGCCTVTVGDGQTTFGDYTSINTALAAIPLGQPGKICVLPGVYTERVIIEDRSDLVIEGCGGNTIIKTPTADPTSAGLVMITACTNVTLKDLKIEAAGQFGVMVYLDGTSARSRRIRLEGLDVLTKPADSPALPVFAALWIPTGFAPFPLSTVAARQVDDLRIEGCKLTMDKTLSGAPNVSITYCDRVIVRDCQIHSGTTAPGEVSEAWGGVQIGGACQDVAIEGCEIQYGIGCGITFGAVVVDGGVESYRVNLDPIGRFVLTDGADHYGSDAALLPQYAPVGGVGTADIRAYAHLVDVRIRRNRIRFMGSSAISVLGFLPTSEGDTYLTPFSAEDLVIADNTLEINYQRPAEATLDPDYRDYVAFGGIVLGVVDGLRIHDNKIRSTGVSHAKPVCGIYLLAGENVVIENNQIHDNGPRSGDSAGPGIRAGIALQMVGRSVRAREREVDSTDRFLPAARVRGNVVSQPAGRALQVYGLGPMFVEGNVLVGQGERTETTDIRGRCIDIQNIGQSPELIEAGFIPAALGFLPAPALEYDPYDERVADEELIDGRILFTDNQVRFNGAPGEVEEVKCVTRLNSYGDIAVLDNQFFVTLPLESKLILDTSVTAWSTRTTSNRWEDPAQVIVGAGYLTDASAETVAVLNITEFNQATRCILVELSPTGVGILNNGVPDNNQTFTTCTAGSELAGLLAEVT